MSINIMNFTTPMNKASLRAFKGEDGEPWFIAKDVCAVLGVDTRNIRRDLDDDEIQTLKLRGSGRASLILSEAGFYSLVFRSRKPFAKSFKRWVTHEVLPQIRETGGYIPVADQDDDLIIMAKAHNYTFNQWRGNQVRWRIGEPD